MPSRFRHLLVPVDFSDVGAAAVDTAVELAMLHRAELTLLHVIETIGDEPDESDSEIDDFYRQLESDARTKLAEIVARVEPQGVSIKHEILFGRRVREIVQYSMNRSVDMIVLSSHKLDLDRPQEGMASLSHQVSILAQCPVLLVK